MSSGRARPVKGVGPKWRGVRVGVAPLTSASICCAALTGTLDRWIESRERGRWALTHQTIRSGGWRPCSQPAGCQPSCWKPTAGHREALPNTAGNQERGQSRTWQSRNCGATGQPVPVSASPMCRIHHAESFQRGQLWTVWRLPPESVSLTTGSVALSTRRRPSMPGQNRQLPRTRGIRIRRPAN